MTGATAAEARERSEAPEQLYTLTGETCPEKSAPMRRLTMETLTRFKDAG